VQNFKTQIKELYTKANIEKYISYFKKESEEKEKYIAYIYITLTLFTVSFFGIFAVNPTLSTVSNLKRQYDDNSAVEKALNTKIKALNALNTEYEEITPLLKLIYSAIPTSPEIPPLTRKIEKMAQNNNLNVLRFSVGQIEIFPADKKNAPLFSFSFNLSVEGNQDDITNFMSDIINFDRAVSITAISNEVSESKNQSSNISGKVYFLK